MLVDWLTEASVKLDTGCVQAGLVNFLVKSDRVGAIAFWMSQTPAP